MVGTPSNALTFASTAMCESTAAVQLRGGASREYSEFDALVIEE